jgi:hypothetical protein
MHLDPHSAVGNPSDHVARRDVVRMSGRTMPDRLIAVGPASGGHAREFIRSGPSGRFDLTMRLHPGVNAMTVRLVGMRRFAPMTMALVYVPKAFARPYNGSPTPQNSPFTRIIPNSQAYGANAAPRPAAKAISLQMAEDPDHPSFSSPKIELGLVFFGQFVDHDLNFNSTEEGQGASIDPNNPINRRTPALDLDPVYGGGPHGDPEFYTPDGLFFKLGTNGNDLLRDPNGVAIIGDPRNDDNGMIAQIHLAFQKYHNLLMTRALHGVDPSSLNPAQKDALFNAVHERVIGFYQGIVANQFGTVITGRPISTKEPPLANVPAEFDMAVFRLGHTLVPNTLVVDHQGDRKSPTDPSLRGPGAFVPMDLLFGRGAQPSAKFDDKVSETMRELLILLSPTDPGAGDLIGGDSANIGEGQIIDGVMHLDLVETNILRGREVHLPSGEEYLAMLDHRPYNPATDGNTDLFQYILDEATPLGHLGRVGTDVVDRTIGGLLAADPYRFNNPARFTPKEIAEFQHATFEKLLHQIGTPGF